ncbi:helix-turn-helix transcriptional regulator [Amycolatopsis sp. NPDC051372]|uniref:helix-turn-helix domain-containing protein n=1 Tax=unclassified Amycolatopsis TaxID=2618356 RepID=UPI00344360CA
MRADGFAERARRELVAAGAVVEARAASPSERLSGREATIARPAAEGCTDSEIAAQLFLSGRTVEWHRGKIFGKRHRVEKEAEGRTQWFARGQRGNARARGEARRIR